MKKIIKTYYVMTPCGRKTFQKWLKDKDLSMRKFAKRCGCSTAYISRVVNAKSHITKSVIKLFNKGGYDLI